MVAISATYTATGQPKSTTASSRYFDTISEPVSTAMAPTAATTGSVGVARACSATV